jgi:hypothetical protein
VDKLNVPVIVNCDFQYRVGSADVHEDGRVEMRITDPVVLRMLEEPGLIALSLAPVYVANAQRLTST